MEPGPENPGGGVGNGPADKVDAHRFPCDRCGSDMRYAPGRGRLVCDHCGFEAEIEGSGDRASALRELNLDQALAASLPAAETEEIRTVHCPNCGAVVELEGARHAADCPFCGTPVVIDTGAWRRIRPRALLPFAIDEGAARKALGEWLGSLWFAPSGLAAFARKGRRMRGVYVPYWTFDAATRSRYRGERGIVHTVTRTRHVNGERRTVREQRIRWTRKSGTVSRMFDDVLVLGSTSLPTRYTDALEPWDLAELEPYRPEFLAGFSAEGYTVDIDDAFREARKKMARIIERDVRFDIGGDRQRIHEIDTEYRDVTFKHILLPVWTAVYRYRGRPYRLVVNGRTGRVQGERPWSAWKLAAAIMAGALVAGAIGYFVAISQGAP